jgi:hypothetical protein
MALTRAPSRTKNPKWRSGSQSSTDGGSKNLVNRSTIRKLLIADKPEAQTNQRLNIA